MHEFAIVVLLGIGILKVVDMLGEYFELAQIRTLLTIVLAVVTVWALDFSLFGSWGIEVRSELLGYIATGLMVTAGGYLALRTAQYAADVLDHGTDRDIPKAA